MPSITKKMIKGKPYYYLRECQRVNGKPKIIWTTYLGTPETIRDRILNPEPHEIEIFEFGASAAAFDIASTLDIVSIVDRHCPKRTASGPSVGQYVLLAALNRCVAPGSKAQLAQWYKKSVLKRLLPVNESQLTSQRFWDTMDRVSEEQIRAIEQDVSSRAVSAFGLELHHLLFDSTNFFTFVDSFNDRAELPQRGHSKEGRDNLRLLGLALLVTSDGHVPLFHHTYAGNRHDAFTFGTVIEEISSRCRQLADGAADITLIFDKGNNSEDNLSAVDNGPYHFVGSLVPTHYKELLSIPRTKMRRLDKQLPEVWSYRTVQKVFGIPRTVLCTFNQALFDAQHETLVREIAKRIDKLTELKAKLDTLKDFAPAGKGKKPTIAGTENAVKEILSGRHMKELFTAQVRKRPNGLPELSFEFDYAAWKELQATLLGKTVLFTDREDWTDEQIVLGYRSQHHVEEAFRCLKNPHFLTFRPTFHWTDQKLRVHAFYCVLALTILSLLRRKLAKAGIHLSIPTMMEKLADIKEVTVVYSNPEKQTAPLVRRKLSKHDPEQKAMLDTLQMNQYRQA
jgi:transposase